jgi:hypothetical protein
VYLDDLGGVGTDHVSANDSVGLPVDDELQKVFSSRLDKVCLRGVNLET